MIIIKLLQFRFIIEIACGIKLRLKLKRNRKLNQKKKKSRKMKKVKKPKKKIEESDDDAAVQTRSQIGKKHKKTHKHDKN